MKRNMCFYKDDEEIWISRSVAVVCFTLAPINGKWCVLANQRGKGTPDFQGYWNAPCGYLDYNETTAECAIRETLEETGVKIHNPTFWSFNDIPDDGNQNVTFRYYAILPEAQQLNVSALECGEENEVDSLKWIPIDEIDNYEWAFNHHLLIKILNSELQLCHIQPKIPHLI